jgi:hypothetical protein
VHRDGDTVIPAKIRPHDGLLPTRSHWMFINQPARGCAGKAERSDTFLTSTFSARQMLLGGLLDETRLGQPA